MSIATEIQRLQTAKANIKTAIENKGVTVGDGTIDTYADKINEISSGGSGDYEQGFEDGKNSVVQLDRYLKTAQFTSLNMFGKSEAVFNFDNIVNSLGNLFYCDTEEKRNTTVEHLTINCPTLITSISQMLYCDFPYTDVTLKRLTLNVDTQACSNYKNAFTHQRALEIIDGKPLDYSSATASNINGFSNCIALVEVRFVANSIKYSISFANCGLLSTETIQSIIDGIADLTGGTAQTLTLHSIVGGKLTDEQKATITAKNWTLVY